MSKYQDQYSGVKLPKSTVTGSFPASAAGTTIDLSSMLGFMISIKCTEPAAVKAGSSSGVTATSADYPFTADMDYGALVTPDTAYVSFCGLGTAGTVYIAITSV